MGQEKSHFTEEQLEDYQDLTYFSKKEIIKAHEKFRALAPEKVSHQGLEARVPLARILQLPELRVNPFGERLCRVFSTTGNGDCTFDDFIDMMSALSPNAPKSLKAEHAFRVFDYDGDDMLGVDDLRNVINSLIGDGNGDGVEWKLRENELNTVVQRILDEADLDDDGALSFAEFEHIVDKSPDFANSFCIRL